MNTMTTMTRRFLKPMLGASLLIAGSALACPPESDCESVVKTVEWTTASIPTMWSTAVATAPAQQVWFSPATVAWTPQDAKKDAPKQTVVKAKEITIVVKDGEHTLEFTRSGEKMSAKVDGKEVPAKRIVEADNVIIIRGEDGQPLFTLNRQGGGIAFRSGDATSDKLMTLRAAGDVAVTSAPGGGVYTLATTMKPPKAMIGITMGEIEDVTAAQLGVNSDDVVLVTGVAPNLPAAKAGLKQYDVIVKIDGEKPVTEAKIREIITRRDPGEKVGVVVLRESKPMEFEVELQEFKADAWGDATATFKFMDEGNQLLQLHPELDRERMRLLVEPKLQMLSDQFEISPEALNRLQNRALDLTQDTRILKRLSEDGQVSLKKLTELFEKELKSTKLDEALIPTVRDAFNRAAKQLEQKVNPLLSDLPLSVQIVPKGDGDQALVMPRLTEEALRFATPSEARGASGDRLQRLEERMKRLEALLEKLVEQRESGADR